MKSSHTAGGTISYLENMMLFSTSRIERKGGRLKTAEQSYRGRKLQRVTFGQLATRINRNPTWHIYFCQPGEMLLGKQFRVWRACSLTR